MKYSLLFSAVILAVALITSCQDTPEKKAGNVIPVPVPVKGYADINGIKMYYEIHGKGQPLVMLHGAYGSMSSFSAMVPVLSQSRKVILIDLRGHGRTSDSQSPITYEQMADDVAALLKKLDTDSADIFGYSMGGGVTLQLAIRHPELLRKIIVASASYKSSGMHEEFLRMIPSITPEIFEGSPYKIEYDSISPDPSHFPVLFAKLKKLDETPYDWKSETIKAFKTPALIIVGDADIVKTEHALEMYKLLGGGKAGDLAGLPPSQLAVLPGTMHITVPEKTDLLLPMINNFLDHTHLPKHIGQL